MKKKIPPKTVCKVVEWLPDEVVLKPTTTRTLLIQKENGKIVHVNIN